MQIVRSEAVDSKKVILSGHHWGQFTKLGQVPNKGDQVRINVFVTDPTKSSGEQIGAYVEVNAKVFGDPLPPHNGRVFLRQGDGSYKEVDGQDKPSSISLRIESEDDFPKLHGEVVFAEVFDLN